LELFFFLLVEPLEPIITEQFNGVRAPDGSVSTGKIIAGAHFLATPTDALRMLRMGREFCHLYCSRRVLPCPISYFYFTKEYPPGCDSGHSD
jgi:hypothetical protein